MATRAMMRIPVQARREGEAWVARIVTPLGEVTGRGGTEEAAVLDAGRLMKLVLGEVGFSNIELRGAVVRPRPELN